MKTYSKEELDKILELHSKWLNDKKGGVRGDLYKANLSHANLSHANLSHADLSYADLSDADLSNADLSHADLSHADLSNANLYSDNMSNANLYKANLSRANLTNANLTNANLTNANLYKADLSDADLSYANLVNVKDVISFTLTRHYGYAWKKSKEVIVKIGCEEHNLEDWLRNYEEIEARNKYDDVVVKLYALMLNLIKESF